MKCAQRAGFDWINLGLHRGVAWEEKRRYIFFFPMAFFPKQEKKKMGTGARLEHDHRPTPDQRAPH